MSSLKNALKRLEFLCLLHNDVMEVSDIAVIFRYIANSGLSSEKVIMLGIKFFQYILFHDYIDTFWDDAAEVIADEWVKDVQLDGTEMVQLIDAIEKAAVHLCGCDGTEVSDENKVAVILDKDETNEDYEGPLRLVKENGRIVVKV